MKSNLHLDDKFMKRALLLAQKGKGKTSPNPLVGAVIVKNGKVLAFGYHKKCGLPHAEIDAMQKLKKKDINGATIYINLEPCVHFGKTPPCVDEIITNKIKRVVIATLDPNPLVRGKSIRKLKSNGISVTVGIMSAQAKKVNEVFFKNMKEKRPFVVLKVAQSLDGKIATYKNVSKWITTLHAREFARSLRDEYDCVLVGANTLVKDNPKLNGLKKIPFKAVIDPNLKIPANSYVFKNNPDKLIIFSSHKLKKNIKKIPKSVNVVFLKEVRGELSIASILKSLYSFGIMSVFVEGGADTLGRFLKSKLIDKAYFFISPKIIGGKNALGSIGGQGCGLPQSSPILNNVIIKEIGEDILISGYPKY